MAKRFQHNAPVEIRRDTGITTPWELATYVEPIADWPGHHEVLLHGEPRYINRTNAEPTTADDPNAIATKRFYVPSRRIRAKQ